MRVLELLEAPGVEAELREVELQGVLVQDSHHRLLAEDGRQGGDAQVDLAGPVAQLDAAVLGQAALGDVERGHDLHARGQGRLQALGRGHDLVQHAVDPEAHADDLLAGLDVDVRGPAPDGVGEHHVDQPHHRRLVGRLQELEHVGLRPGLLFRPPRRPRRCRGCARHRSRSLASAPPSASPRRSTACRIRRGAATSGRTLRFVMNATLSRAITSVGSAMARLRVSAARSMGST